MADSPGEDTGPPRPLPAAPALLDEAEALVSPIPWAALQAEVLLARAEVERLAGAPEQAGAAYGWSLASS